MYNCLHFADTDSWNNEPFARFNMTAFYSPRPSINDISASWLHSLHYWPWLLGKGTTDKPHLSPVGEKCASYRRIPSTQWCAAWITPLLLAYASICTDSLMTRVMRWLNAYMFHMWILCVSGFEKKSFELVYSAEPFTRKIRDTRTYLDMLTSIELKRCVHYFKIYGRNVNIERTHDRKYLHVWVLW